MAESEYCGFLCADVTERQQEIIDELAGLKQVNPEFCAVMTNRLLKMFDSLKVSTSKTTRKK